MGSTTKTKSAKVGTKANAKSESTPVSWFKGSERPDLVRVGGMVQVASCDGTAMCVVGVSGSSVMLAQSGVENCLAEELKNVMVAEVRAEPTAPKPEGSRGETPKLPRIRAGLVFADDAYGYGTGVIVNVVGEDVYVIHADGTANVFQDHEIANYLAEENREVGDFFDSVADIIAAKLFPLHGATAPFAPHKGLPVPLATRPARDGIGGMNEDETFKPTHDLFGSLVHLRHAAYPLTCYMDDPRDVPHLNGIRLKGFDEMLARNALDAITAAQKQLIACIEHASLVARDSETGKP